MRRKDVTKRSAYTAEELVRYTRLLRKALRIHGRKTTNLLVLVELLKKFFPRLVFRIVSNDDLPDAEARAYPRRWVIKYTEGIQEGLLRGSVRARWTLLHEIGHIALAHPGKPFRRKVKDDSRIELEAHLFAAEFLAPAEMVKQYQTVEQLSSAFQISYDAAERRFKEIAARERSQQFGSRPKHRIDAARISSFEDSTALICNAIQECMQETQLPVQVYKDNLLGTSLLTAKASELLMDCYESLRGPRLNDKPTVAATLVAAICSVLPIREIGSSELVSKDVSILNQKLALKVARSVLALDTHEDAALPEPPSVLMEWRSQYLASLLSFGGKLLEGHPVDSLCLYDTPTLATYNLGDDTSWCEIHALERLIELMTMASSR